MDALNFCRSALIVWAAAVALAGCAGSHATISPVPGTEVDTRTAGTKATEGGAFHGGYSGVEKLSKCSFPWSGEFDFAGTGKISFLGSSTESATLAQEFNDKLYCARWSGSVTLTSSEHPKDQISIALRGDKRPSPCGHRLVYGVTGGSGKFEGATGNGTVAIQCSRHAGSSTYSDQWSGTLYFPEETSDGSGVNDETKAAVRVVVRHGPPPSSYQVLHRFGGTGDGVYPASSLSSLDGTLYGTTPLGGAKGGYGTVFSVTTTGTEKVLHTFAEGSDGVYPSGLIDIKGTLYGATSGGGANGFGAAFSVTRIGAEKVLYSFAGGTDGANPEASLLDVHGTLYGTTWKGGASGNGTVFSVTTNGTEKVLYSFAGGSDGELPNGLINVNGTLYGTTQEGGASGAGTVFSVTTTGTEKVLYSFAGGADGAYPGAPLLNMNGTLYGTTQQGGVYSYYGTVFSVTTTGTEKVLYSFAGGSDGMHPLAGLINFDGRLYGTTSASGMYGAGPGTIFSVTKSGTEKVVYGFGGVPNDGANPEASLLDVNGTLYGTTANGGLACRKAHGCGIVFAFTP